MSDEDDPDDVDIVDTSWLAIFAPASDAKSLCIALGEKGADSSIIWQPLWQALEIEAVANNPPAVASYAGKTFVFYPSAAEDTQYLFYNTCSGMTWSGQQKIAVAQTNTGAGAAVLNDTLYVFWQGIDMSFTGFPSSGALLYAPWDGTDFQPAYQIGVNATLSGCPSAVAFNGELYVFYGGGDNSGNLCYMRSATGAPDSWSGSIEVASIVLSNSPATTVFANPTSGQDELYVFYQGEGLNGQLWYNVLDAAGTWAGERQVDGAYMSATPGAMVVGGVLYAFFEGGGNDGTLWYTSSLDGSTWSDPLQVMGTRLSCGPTMAVLNSEIYCIMQGPGNDNDLFYTTLSPGSSATGTVGSYMTRINNACASLSPSAIASGSDILFAYATYNDYNSMVFVRGASTGWQPGVYVGGAETASAPSLIEFNNLLYVFFQGHTGNAFCYSTSSDGGVSWDGPTTVSNRALWSAPATAALGDNLYVFHAAANDNGRLYCSVLSIGGSWSSDDEVSITNLTSLYGPFSTFTSPAACTYAGNVFVAYTTGNYICVVAYTPATIGYCIDVGGAPTNIAFVSYDNGSGTRLYCFYQAGTSGDLYYISSSDPINSTWSAPVEISNTPPSSSPPGAVSELAGLAISCLTSFP
jgi:hypothetical protein